MQRESPPGERLDPVGRRTDNRRLVSGETGEDEPAENEKTEHTPDQRAAEGWKKPGNNSRDQRRNHCSVEENLSALERESKSSI